jgi:hypothetical protein
MIVGADTVSLAGQATMMRRVVVGLLAAFAFLVVIAVPTDLIDTPWFSREIPPTWWSWPSLIVTSILSGVLAATYVRAPGNEDTEAASRQGIAGGLLTFFAVGCPVCNKLVLVALGSAGAMSWFAPVQPLLVVAGIAALAWALRSRIASQRHCALASTRRAP